MKIEFTIFGNQDDIGGNAIPYLRMTQHDKWKPTARRYQNWKSHVRAAMLEALLKTVKLNRSEMISALYAHEPPLKPKEKAHMELKIFYKDKTHADSDNVFKGIADALFKNDKYLCGAFDFGYDPKLPRVEVKINYV